MKLAQDIIIKPIITEKSMMDAQERKYTFKVADDANKIEIKFLRLNLSLSTKKS